MNEGAQMLVFVQKMMHVLVEFIMFPIQFDFILNVNKSNVF